jgi:hypothetical protein
MATYDISVHCQDCGKVHPVLLRIDLDGGPDEKGSVADVYRGCLLPPQLAAIKGQARSAIKRAGNSHSRKMMIFFSFRPQNSDATQLFDSTLVPCYRAGARSVSTHYVGIIIIIIREPPNVPFRIGCEFRARKQSLSHCLTENCCHWRDGKRTAACCLEGPVN